MSWTLKRKARLLLETEEGAIRKDRGGRLAVALVYPNTYAVGMSNLGFQTIYAHLNALPDVVCERVFFPDPEDIDEQQRTGTAPFSLESLRPRAAFPRVPAPARRVRPHRLLGDLRGRLPQRGAATADGGDPAAGGPAQP